MGRPRRLTRATLCGAACTALAMTSMCAALGTDTAAAAKGRRSTAAGSPAGSLAKQAKKGESS